MRNARTERVELFRLPLKRLALLLTVNVVAFWIPLLWYTGFFAWLYPRSVALGAFLDQSITDFDKGAFIVVNMLLLLLYRRLVRRNYQHTECIRLH